MEVFGENRGQNLRFCVKIGARISDVAFLKNPPKKSSRVTRGAKSRMRRTETPKPIWIKFCMVVDIPDVVTYTNFGDHRLRGFWVAGGQISLSPIDFHRRPYNTLALPCERVMELLSTAHLRHWLGLVLKLFSALTLMVERQLA